MVAGTFVFVLALCAGSVQKYGLYRSPRGTPCTFQKSMEKRARFKDGRRAISRDVARTRILLVGAKHWSQRLPPGGFCDGRGQTRTNDRSWETQSNRAFVESLQIIAPHSLVAVIAPIDNY